MKSLMKVKLINWHTFTNTEFPIYHNALITGENGTGKSTILDALQYVLTVGKCKFNKAASDIGSRTLESYMRGKTGIEGKEYLRNQDVTTYICLEFYDEKTSISQVIGTVIDLNSSRNIIPEFFQITHCQIKDLVFIQGNKVLNRSDFKKKVIELGYSSIFKDRKKEAESLFANALGLTTKYFDLVTRALAFKAIDNVYQFILDFLLKEDDIDINDLRISIQKYQNLERKLDQSQDEYNHLEVIINEYNEYKEYKEDNEVLEYIKEKTTALSLKENTKDINKQINALKSKNEYLERNILTIQNEIDSINQELNQLDQSMKENKTYQLKKEYEEQSKQLSLTIKKEQNTYNKLIEDIIKESKILTKYKSFKEFHQYINNKQYDSETLNQYFQEIIPFINTKTDEINTQTIKLKQQIKQQIDQYNEYISIYNSLKNNQFVYKKEVNELIQLLKQKLFEHYGNHIEVKPLCEYLEIKDERWRNAVEGYLNSQRFDLIIEPQYYEYSVMVYEEYKGKHGIYGVGIVDVARLKKYDEYDIDNTLASKIEFKNIYARWYAKMILSRVKCVDDVRSLRHHKVAITPSCMLYKNYTVRAIDPKIYKTPFIGLGAIDIQKANLVKVIEEKEKEINILKSELTLIKDEKEHLSSSKANIIYTQLNLIDDYQSNVNEYEDLKEKMKRLKLDDSILSLQIEYDLLYQKSIDIKNKYQNQIEDLGKNKQNIDTLTKQYEINTNNYNQIHSLIKQLEQTNILLTKKGNEQYKEYKELYKNNDKIKNQIEIKINKNNTIINKKMNNIQINMNNYNKEFNIGYENSIDSISDYDHRYQLLRDIEIVKQKDRCLTARLKCEDSFKTSFIARLKEKIENAKNDIHKLNKGLSQRNFNGETYEFVVTPTNKENFKEYCKIILSGQDFMSDNLFAETLDEQQRKVMEELFSKLATVETNKETEKMLKEYTDYRNYLDYDIKIKYNDGSFAYFSKVNKEKSGGETQTPFYVIMAASFEQVVKKRLMNEDFGCVVIFDEAFNNMDEQRIQEMIKFYNERDIQTFIAVPPSRASSIIPYVNTRLLTIKHNNHSFVEVIKDEEL